MIWSRSCSLRRAAPLPAFSKRENISSTSRWSCFSSAIASVPRPLLRLRGAPVALRVDGADLRAAFVTRLAVLLAVPADFLATERARPVPFAVVLRADFVARVAVLRAFLAGDFFVVRPFLL